MNHRYKYEERMRLRAVQQDARGVALGDMPNFHRVVTAWRVAAPAGNAGALSSGDLVDDFTRECLGHLHRCNPECLCSHRSIALRPVAQSIGLMFVDLMSCSNVSVDDKINGRSSFACVSKTFRFRLRIFSRISVDLSALPISAFNLSTIGCGIPGGPKNPNHDSGASKAARLSLIVGISGAPA